MVEGTHPPAGRRLVIEDGPQTHDDRASPGKLEGAAEAEHAFAGANLSKARVTRRQHRPLSALQIEGGDLFSGQNSCVFSCPCAVVALAPANARPASSRGLSLAPRAGEAETRPPTPLALGRPELHDDPRKNPWVARCTTDGLSIQHDGTLGCRSSAEKRDPPLSPGHCQHPCPLPATESDMSRTSARAAGRSSNWSRLPLPHPARRHTRESPVRTNSAVRRAADGEQPVALKTRSHGCEVSFSSKQVKSLRVLGKYRCSPIGSAAKLTRLSAPSGTMNTWFTPRRYSARGSQMRLRSLLPTSRYARSASADDWLATVGGPRLAAPRGDCRLEGRRRAKRNGRDCPFHRPPRPRTRCTTARRAHGSGRDFVVNVLSYRTNETIAVAGSAR